MRITRPLPLHHSWPLFEAEQRLHIADTDGSLHPETLLWAETGWAMGLRLADQGIGLWDCDLADDRLHWSAGVYDLFGVPRGEAIDRKLAVATYTLASRAAMEELRAHAIRYCRGFTVDTELRLPDGGTRWMRLSAIPVLRDRRAVRLRGMKRDVTALYDTPAKARTAPVALRFPLRD